MFALLIATAHVDDQLTKLIEASMPSELSKNHKDRVLKYPGPLSSFASKIELAYVFRLINKNLYDSLNALRKIRNDAAHSPSKFELHELNEKLREIYDLGPGTTYVITELSTQALVECKMRAIKSILDKYDLDEEGKHSVIGNIINDKERMSNLEKQVPFWELAFGLSLLCSLLIYYRDEIIKVGQSIETWGDLGKFSTEPG